MHVDFYNPELKAAVDPEIPQKSCEFKKLARETRPLSQLFLSQPEKAQVSSLGIENVVVTGSV